MISLAAVGRVAAAASRPDLRYLRAPARHGPPWRAGAIWACLLDRDGGPGTLKGGLGLVRGLLVNVLEHRLRRAVDQILGLLEAEAGERPDLLDDLDLLVACGLENDVELVLLLGLFGSGAAARRGRTGHRDRGRGLDVEGVLELLYELRELEQRHLLERVEQCVVAELRHSSSCSFLVP